jgi:LmbE family N-acetylglucosaminyl deacetylase
MHYNCRVPNTIVAVHAHPDDEAIFTGGTLRRAVRRGWRTVVVFATAGEAGFACASGDTGARRRHEAVAACERLGVDRVAFLGFGDSGDVPGGPFPPGSFAATPIAVAAARLDELLAGETPTVLTGYDQHGVYGHPDHVAVHRLVSRYAVETGVPAYAATVCRRHLRSLRDELLGRSALAPGSWPTAVTERLGLADDRLLAADVTAELVTKRAAIAAHGSQVMTVPTFMGLPPGAFERLLAHEWFHPAGPGRSPAFEDLLATTSCG